jgi:LacI family transcriptional regulator
VSRVIRRQDRVSATARARVRPAIGGPSYVPDGTAQSLSRRRKEVIGFICIQCPGQRQDVENKSPTYHDEVLRGVERRISGLGWSLLVTFWNGEAGQDFSQIAAMPGRVDGILISIGSFPSWLLEWIARRVPVAVIAGDPDERDVDVVTADNLSGSAAILTHLVEDHGKRRIYHVDGPPGMPDTAQRRSGLLQVLRDHPAARLAGATHGSNHVESGLVAGQRILAECRDQLPDAVVAANDQMAIGVLRSLTAAGVRVPEQVAVAGFDDIFPARLCEPPLTTVHQPMGMLGERACDRLLKRIATPSLPPQVELLRTELVLRQSCGCPPGTLIRRPVERGKPTTAEPPK